MIRNLYSIHDKLHGFLQPVFDQDDYSAQRGFRYSLSSNELMKFSPADFALYFVGTFDDDSGEFKPSIPPRFIMNGSEQEVKND